jgi:hypothetical protein
MMQYIVRLSVVILIVACMGWLGLFLMFIGGPWFPRTDDPWTRWVVSASVVIWAGLGAVLGRRDVEVWSAWGLVSPLLGCILVAPPASFALIVMKGYIAFPIGLATGVLVWCAFRVGSRPNRPRGHFAK